jgi:hypothetical protein
VRGICKFLSITTNRGRRTTNKESKSTKYESRIAEIPAIIPGRMARQIRWPALPS